MWYYISQTQKLFIIIIIMWKCQYQNVILYKSNTKIIYYYYYYYYVEMLELKCDII